MPHDTRPEVKKVSVLICHSQGHIKVLCKLNLGCRPLG